MRNLLTSAIASVALATLFAGSASAADMSSYGQRSVNPAEQAQLDRDSTQNRLHQSPAGVVIIPGDQAADAQSRADQGAFAEGSSPWLTQSPRGEVVGQGFNSASEQAAGLNSSRDD